MKALFGLRIFPERKPMTDDEFVSQARTFLAKYEGKRKWLLGISIVTAVAAVLLLGIGIILVARMAPLLQGVPGAQEIWFILGLFVGWIGGHMLTSAVHSVIEIVSDTQDIRTKRLLIRYYDACMNGCRDDMAADGMEANVG
jgi:hypothetical protein